MEDFGVIVACCHKDYNFAKGCCASIRYFMGNVPICLIVDGIFSTEKLEKAYGVNIINRNSVRHSALKNRSFGFGLTKMIAFWESPWERFLFLDADTVVWGNLLESIKLEQIYSEYDLIADHAPEYLTKDIVSNFFFDVDSIEKFFPKFRWQNYQYWVTGVFFAKRGIFKLEEYLELLDFDEKNPGIFKLGEQGILNFMTFRAVQEERIKATSQKLQILVRHHSKEQLQSMFPIHSKGPILKDTALPAVIHWAGAKPFIVNTDLFSEPMNFFRYKFIFDVWDMSEFLAKISLAIEDFHRFRPKTRFISKLPQLIQTSNKSKAYFSR
jgi:lipopolysaccharide biosynthesis glycosyltransferase